MIIINISLKDVPFSKYGSYLTFSNFCNLQLGGEDLYLRNIQGDTQDRNIFLIKLTYNNEIIDFIEEVEPSKLKLISDKGYIEVCFSGTKTIRFQGLNVGLKLIMEKPGNYDNAILYNEKSWEVNSYTNRTKVMLTSLKGSLNMLAPWEGMKCNCIEAEFSTDSDGIIEGALETFETSYEDKTYSENFLDCLNNVKIEFDTWLNKTVEVPEKFAKAREIAAYTNWCSVVEPRDLLKISTMYMSKNHMTNVWSWDHCFNAMALVRKNPQEAWEQFVGMFDHQDKFGALPDCINDKFKVLSFCKPPIHGWALKWMMDRADYIDKTKLQFIYEPLCKWTNWWFIYRDYNKNGMPQYNHGNDSGWDNSTIFHKGAPVESPDLATFLILQMETLSEIAKIIGKIDEAALWDKRSLELRDKMISIFWKGDKFTWLCPSQEGVPGSDSLILYLPILLGTKLPSDISRALVKDLKEEGRFLTDFGFATESIKSPYYEEDGYWRGPIWAPPTFMIVDSLKKLGENNLSISVAEKYCRLFEANGAAENFNALSGKPLRDKAYTWTSSVFLILASEYI